MVLLVPMILLMARRSGSLVIRVGVPALARAIGDPRRPGVRHVDRRPGLGRATARARRAVRARALGSGVRRRRGAPSFAATNATVLLPVALMLGKEFLILFVRSHSGEGRCHSEIALTTRVPSVDELIGRCRPTSARSMSSVRPARAIVAGGRGTAAAAGPWRQRTGSVRRPRRPAGRTAGGAALRGARCARTAAGRCRPHRRAARASRTQLVSLAGRRPTRGVPLGAGSAHSTIDPHANCSSGRPCANCQQDCAC